MTDTALMRPRALLAELVSAAELTFGGELRAVVVTGSLVRHGGRDFLPFFSDVDCHLYLAAAAMRSAVTPRLDLALAIQERLGDVDAAGYEVGSWSLAFWDEQRLYDWALQPLPAQYEVVAGQLPPTFREGTADEYMARSEQALKNMAESADRAVRYCADLPDLGLAGHLRTIASWVKAALASAATVASGDAYQGWASPLAHVLAVVEPSIVPSRSASRFYSELHNWPSVRTEPARLRALVGLAVTVLDEIDQYFSSPSS